MRKNHARRGAAGQQYAIIVGLIGVIALASISFIGSNIKTLFVKTGNVLTGVTNVTSGSGGTPTTTGSTCKSIKDSGGSSGDGVYTLSGTGLGASVQAYCDMTTDGGGWMLALNYLKAKGAVRTSAILTSPPLMDPNLTLGSTDAATSNWGHLSASSFSTLQSNGFTEFRASLGLQ